jgi:hypothetical protein
MKKVIPLMLILIFSCKKTDVLSGKMEIPVNRKTSVTIKNGTNNSVDLFHWRLKEDVFNIPTNTVNEFRWGDATLLQTGNSITYTAAALKFSLDALSKISLYDSSRVLIATN